MIADTAIEGHSLKPKDIAERLHEIGYNGFMCDLKFNENGSQASDVYTYDVMDDNGYADTYEVGNR
jgi:hypothetical protein